MPQLDAIIMIVLHVLKQLTFYYKTSPLMQRKMAEKLSKESSFGHLFSSRKSARHSDGHLQATGEKTVERRLLPTPNYSNVE